MECNDIIKQLDAWADQELSPEQTRKVETHLNQCPACSRKAVTLLDLVRAMDRLPTIAAPKGFSRQVCRALQSQSPDLVRWWHHLTPAWQSIVCGVAIAGLVCGAMLGTQMPGPQNTDTRPALYMPLADSGEIYP